MAEKKIDLKESTIKKNKNLIIPLKTLQELLRILSDDQDNLEIYSSENQVLFVYNNIEIISRVINGQYPQYEQIIPQKHKTKVIINTEDLTQIVKRASLFCQPGINNIDLKFNPKTQKVTIKVINNQLGENISQIKAKIEGEENSIIFNYRYLLDGLLNIGSKEVSLEMTDSESPCLFKPIDKKGYLYIIMPIKQ